LGSGEFEAWSTEVDHWLLDRATGDGSILILPTASAPEGDQVFDAWAQLGVAHYASAGRRVEVLPVRDRVDADDATLVEMVSGASLVFFSGGNPAYLARVLVQTALWRAIMAGLDRGMAYAGCSAGMACLGRRAPDSTVDSLTDELWQPGLGMFPHAWLGPHWDMLDRYTPGLVQFIVDSIPPQDVLVGVDEKTAIVGDGREWQVVGQGAVQVFAGGEQRTYDSGSSFVRDLFV
jgi:cyanophycinase